MREFRYRGEKTFTILELLEKFPKLTTCNTQISIGGVQTPITSVTEAILKLVRAVENRAPNHAAALQDLEAVAKHGNIVAQRNLMHLYKTGRGVPINAAKVLEYEALVADQGDLTAQKNVARMYKLAQGTESNTAKALHYYTLAANQGDLPSQLEAAALYFAAKDYGNALKYYLKVAERGHVEGIYMAGYLYHQAHETSLAVPYYLQAIEKGDSRAYFKLGSIYFQGEDVVQDYDLAFTYMQKAFEKNDPEARWFLALCHYHGKGVKQDYAKAIPYLQAVQLGKNYSEAQELLGECYLYGRGVAVDKKKAIQHLLHSDTKIARDLLKEVATTKNLEHLRKELTHYLGHHKNENSRLPTMPLLNLLKCYFETVPLDELVQLVTELIPGNWVQPAILAKAEEARILERLPPQSLEAYPALAAKRSALALQEAIQQLESLASKEMTTHNEVLQYFRMIVQELTFFKLPQDGLSQEDKARIEASIESINKLMPKINFAEANAFAINHQLKELWEQELMSKLGLQIPYYFEMDTSQDERIAREFGEG